MVEAVIEAYKTEGFPLETVYLDIPYMKDYLDFTVDTDKFPKLPEMADNLHKNNQNLVLIIDAGISAMDLENKYYKLGNEANAFIKSGIYKSEKYNNNLLLDVW